MHDDEVPVDEALVRRLLTAQLPTLADLPLRIVEPWGTDNAIWRLGDELVVRLPRIGWAGGQADKEAEWLPVLAPHLTVAIPTPVAVGEPTDEYPYRWAVHRWLPGELAGPVTIGDPLAFASDLARTVLELRAIPVGDAPAAHNRARPIAAYDDATRRAIHSARHLVDVDTALDVWERAVAAPAHPGSGVWVHGDLEGNCIVRDGRLSGLVDWGSACVGDPAVDVQAAWSPLLDGDASARFLELVAADEATIARAKGAAVNQACAALPYYLETYPLIVERCEFKLAALGIEVRGVSPRARGGTSGA